MTREYERIAEIVSQILGVATSQLNPQTNFARDLGADELDRIELCYELEEEFCIRIPDRVVTNLQTIEEALEMVQETQKKSSS